MPDPFVPEADVAEQHQDAAPSNEVDDEEVAESSARHPGVPIEAPEADVLEQNQPVEVEEFEEHDVVVDDRPA